MNRYQNQTPRAAFAIAAVVMSLVTIAAFVGPPSAIDAGDVWTMMARADRATLVTISPARVDVVASREAPVTVADASSVVAGR